MRRLLCFFGWHVPSIWRYAKGEISWTYCTACQALLYKGLAGEEYAGEEYFEP